jgi:hypothetical protein
MFALRYLALPLLLLSISASLFAEEAKPTREEGSARNRGSRQDAQADHTAPDHPKVEVYCCAVQTYRPWIKRPAPPRDYNPYHFSAHVEVYLPELGVAYLPASVSLVTADRKRYS